MSQWDARVRDHAVWAEMQQCGIAVDSAFSREGLDAESIAGLERLRLVLALIGKRLASTDPLLVAAPSLLNLNTTIGKVRNELESYAALGNIAHITTANTYADDAIAYLAQVPGPVTSEDMTVISEAASNYRTTVNRYLKNAQQVQSALEEATKANATKLATLAESITNEQNRFTTILSDHQTQFSSAQDNRATVFSTTIAEQKTLFSTDQDSRKTLFSESQLENQKNFSAVIVDYTTKLKEHELDTKDSLQKANEDHQEKLDELRVTYENSASDILVKMNEHKAAIESLVGVIGNLGVTSGYQKVANYARKMVVFWQLLTVAALFGLIYVAYVVAFPPPDKETLSPIILSTYQADKPKVGAQGYDEVKDKKEVTVSASVQVKQNGVNEFAFLEGLATRIFLSITFGIFAAYAARQAGRFFEMEQQNRRRALELEALGPFIEPIEKIDRDKFRVQIGERSFAVPNKDSHEYKENDPVTALSLLKPKEWIEGVVSIIKASKN